VEQGNPMQQFLRGCLAHWQGDDSFYWLSGKFVSHSSCCLFSRQVVWKCSILEP